MFRWIDTERHRAKTRYAYPPSPSSSDPPESPIHGPPPVSHRLQALQAELSALEADISDPTNPILVDEQKSGIDPGELLRGLVDVRGRLEKINGIKTGRGKFVNAVIDGGRVGLPDSSQTRSTPVDKRPERQVNPQDLAELDERVGELESVIGASAASLDEVCAEFVRCCMELNIFLSVVTATTPGAAVAHAAKHSDDDPYATSSY